MQYENVWKKVLRDDEKVDYEFSVGSKYRTLGIIISCVLGALFLPAAGLGVIIILGGLFYYGFYLKAANAYAFTNKRVLIHRGWLSTNTTSIEYSKITDTHVQEPFFERLMTKTGNIAINTAGSGSVEIVLKHITAPYDVRKKLDAVRG